MAFPALTTLEKERERERNSIQVGDEAVCFPSNLINIFRSLTARNAMQ